MRLADRMSRLGTETAFDCLCCARAPECRLYVVHSEIGERGIDTPRHIRGLVSKS